MLLALDSATKLNGELREGIREVLLALEPEVASLAPIFELTPPNHEIWQRLVNEAYQRLANVENTSVHAVSVNTECRVLAAAEELRNELRNITSLLRTKLPGVQPPRAASPSITGGDLAREYPALSNRVALAIAHCRSQRCPLSIIMVAVDRTQQSAGLFGSTSFTVFCQWLRMACESELDTSHPLQWVGESGFVMLLEDCERFDAVAAARRLVEQVHRRSGQQGEPWRISAGVACLRLPSRNFPERELIAAAQRCLQGAQTSGGDTVKSLEL